VPTEAPLSIDCVIPAAGLSTRMGSHKLLLEFGSRPLLYWAVHHAVLACQRVIVVVGHDADAVRKVMPHVGALTVVTNPEYEQGMLTSIARGAAEVRTDRFFVAPADMPFLRPALFRTVADSANGQTEAGSPPPAAWFPDYRGRSGHPVLISSSVVPALVSLVAGGNTRGSRLGSMRGFLADYAKVTVPVDEDGSIIDIDTMDALRQHAHRARDSEG